jgi:hypothetical protein
VIVVYHDSVYVRVVGLKVRVVGMGKTHGGKIRVHGLLQGSAIGTNAENKGSK